MNDRENTRISPLEEGDTKACLMLVKRQATVLGVSPSRRAPDAATERRAVSSLCWWLLSLSRLGTALLDVQAAAGAEDKG